MLDIRENVSLKKYNSFGIEAFARYFVEIHNAEDLKELFADKRWKQQPYLILGGGSNMLFTQSYEGLVIKMAIPDISHKIEGDEVIVKAGAGVVWNDFVNYCVNRGFAGVENLSLIPGSVGASPIQNIGAYGTEVKDVFKSCTAFEIESGNFREFTFADCQFAYRESVFKQELKGKYIICSVKFSLSLQANINTSYGAINSELLARGITEPDIRDISEVVSAIRVSKLPDPSTIGNAGSFFKNPIISKEKFDLIHKQFPEIVYFLVGTNQVKLAAGWLIEQCGFKGKVVGNTGTWKNQALVLVNHGKASGREIFDFSEQIIDAVHKKFNVVLEREVNVI